MRKKEKNCNEIYHSHCKFRMKFLLFCWEGGGVTRSSIAYDHNKVDRIQLRIWQMKCQALERVHMHLYIVKSNLFPWRDDKFWIMFQNSLPPIWDGRTLWLYDRPTWLGFEYLRKVEPFPSIVLKNNWRWCDFNPGDMSVTRSLFLRSHKHTQHRCV